jgi:hypothetical protein
LPPAKDSSSIQETPKAFLGRREDDDHDVLELRFGLGAIVTVELTPVQMDR